jgi:hypothetical protein
MDDDALLAATRHDPEAFGAFYRRHERAVFASFRAARARSRRATSMHAPRSAAGRSTGWPAA